MNTGTQMSTAGQQEVFQPFELHQCYTALIKGVFQRFNVARLNS